MLTVRRIGEVLAVIRISYLFDFEQVEELLRFEDAILF